MYWLFLLLALGSILLAISTTQMWLLLLSLFASLVFLFLWIKGLYVARVGSVVNQTARALHPAELQALRAQYQPPQPAGDAAATSAPSLPANNTESPQP